MWSLGLSCHFRVFCYCDKAVNNVQTSCQAKRIWLTNAPRSVVENHQIDRCRWESKRETGECVCIIKEGGWALWHTHVINFIYYGWVDHFIVRPEQAYQCKKNTETKTHYNLHFTGSPGQKKTCTKLIHNFEHYQEEPVSFYRNTTKVYVAEECCFFCCCCCLYLTKASRFTLTGRNNAARLLLYSWKYFEQDNQLSLQD